MNPFLLVRVKPIPLNNVLMDASVHDIIDESDTVSYFQYYVARKVISTSHNQYC